MILASKTGAVEGSSRELADWQQSLRLAYRTQAELLAAVGLGTENFSSAQTNFPILAPREFVNRMEYGNPNDPLLLQVLETEQESQSDIGELDPVGDMASYRGGLLLQKYAHRVLLIASGVCAIHCRYCFRRHFPYAALSRGQEGLHRALVDISSDESIQEVILSGGDPLMLPDKHLKWLVDEIDAISHVQRIRLHTRLPVVIPSRVCDALCDWLKQVRSAVYIVLHVNHANEIDLNVTRAIRLLRSQGVQLLNQAVLLRGVNDSVEAQVELCKQLINLQVIPYYLHLLDPVRNAMHFNVSLPEGLAIIDAMQRELPGYAVPNLVREVCGEKSKVRV
ncbi:MAG: EF-P beta-lysylation protein EpmB [Planctomycetales bacterium]|nr:EF-P beta-lysylation protein EpmB [Planctomycetales bacterium]